MKRKVYNVVPDGSQGTYLTTEDRSEADKCCKEMLEAGKKVHVEWFEYDDPWA